MEDHDQNPPEKTKYFPKYTINNTHNTLYIATYNVKTLSTYPRLLELTESLKNVKYDIIGLSEVRKLGNTIEEHDEFIHYYIGETSGLFGVGFIVKKHLKSCIKSFTGLSERVALLKMNIGNFELSIIQVYAPTEASTEEELELFYSTIDKALRLSGKKIIVMGDFNAKIGQPNPNEIVTGNYGFGIRNGRGDRLIHFAYENNLNIMNTFFKKTKKQKWTWKSPNGITKNEIDYILSNLQKNIQNIQVLNITYPSDHRPVRAAVNILSKTKNRSKYGQCPTSQLKNKEDIQKYTQSLNSILLNLPKNWSEEETVQNCYDKITNAIDTSLKKVKEFLPSTTIEKKQIISARTKDLITRRQEIQKIKPKSRALKNELKALYKLISRRINQDYKAHRTTIIEKHLNNTGSIKKAFKELKTQRSWIGELKNKTKNTQNRTEILKIATDFYKNLYSSPNQHVYKLPFSNIIKTKEIIEESEVVERIMSLKAEKSPGPDKITNEIIKSGCAYLSKPLTQLFNKIINCKNCPSQWSESNIILLYKKGDPNDIGNYRPISLLPSLYKLFSSVIERKIKVTIEAHQPIEQAGFRRGFSTVDHIHSIEMVIEKFQEFKRPLYIVFIDYQKAFDTLLHSSIWEALLSQKVTLDIIEVLKNIYDNCISRVKLEAIGPPIQIKRGVRQGDPLSPTIFIAVLESIISKLNWENVGININGCYLSHLRFADDIVLLSESTNQLQQMINSLHEESRKVGLEINLNKTNVMTNYIRRPIYLENTSLTYVDAYIYLGKQISFNQHNNELEVDRRISITWKKFWCLKEIFKSDMPIGTKTRVMNTCLLPSLTYGCQTWKFTRKLKNKIITCQRSMERSILKIKKIQKIRHTLIRQKTKVIDALSHSQKLKWQWAGHIARLRDNRWTKSTTSWAGPLGQRRRGRPIARWTDDIRKVAGVQWMQKAQDREYWSSLEEAFTFQ